MVRSAWYNIGRAPPGLNIRPKSGWRRYALNQDRQQGRMAAYATAKWRVQRDHSHSTWPEPDSSLVLCRQKRRISLWALGYATGTATGPTFFPLRSRWPTVRNCCYLLLMSRHRTTAASWASETDSYSHTLSLLLSLAEYYTSSGCPSPGWPGWGWLA